MTALVLRLLVDEPLRMFLPARHRSGDVRAGYDGTSSLGHVVQSIGVPLTEVGRLLADGAVVAPSHRPRDGAVVRVRAVDRPQQLPEPARFVLDVHLGSLARRMRLLGLDTRYGPEAEDDELVEAALREQRVLLTKDRSLLRRGVLRRTAGYVRGSTADEQLADVLDRFAPRLAPYSRCTACNGLLGPVAKADVATRLQPGTARSYEEFARCATCGRVYWRGAHARRLDAVVTAALDRTSRRGHVGQ
ncbi:MAG TPA: Mut7-C RNAse domain-containing protein [Candidatus Eisenbacteria bacterium]|nr:Mut7-C RNAse domain-containing protein [Candidatus Eisenbacteria bacterium]